MDSLVTIIAKQQKLKFLDLHNNDFTKEQESRIRKAVASSDCIVIITEDEYIAYEPGQEQAKAAASKT